MKRILMVVVGLSLVVLPALRAQDAAVEEKLNRLNGHVEDLLAAQKVQQERIAELAKELGKVQEQAAKPAAGFASQEELRKLAEKLQEIDQKRVADNEKILREIEKLGRTGTGARTGKKTEKNATEAVEQPAATGGGAEKGFEHVIQSGDTLSTIALAYREKGVKITSDQILKANPGLKPNSLRVGQKIFIPVPQP